MLEAIDEHDRTIRRCNDIIRLTETRSERFTLQSAPTFDGFASRYYELPESALDERLRETIVDNLVGYAADPLKLRLRLRRFDRGDYLLPHRPLPGERGRAGGRLGIIALTASDRDGDCILSGEVCVRYLDRAGKLLEVRPDDWIWVSPIRGARRFSLWIESPGSDP